MFLSLRRKIGRPSWGIAGLRWSHPRLALDLLEAPPVALLRALHLLHLDAQAVLEPEDSACELREDRAGLYLLHLVLRVRGKSTNRSLMIRFRAVSTSRRSACRSPPAPRARRAAGESVLRVVARLLNETPRRIEHRRVRAATRQSGCPTPNSARKRTDVNVVCDSTSASPCANGLPGWGWRETLQSRLHFGVVRLDLERLS